MKMKSKTKDRLIPISAIAGIVILESIALVKGVNGVMFSTAIGFVAGIAGYTMKYIRDR